MLGVNDFIGYYDWTFEFLRCNFGQAAVEHYWSQAIAKGAVSSFYDRIKDNGIMAMVEHWAYSAIGEQCSFHICFSSDYFRYDMHDCPSLGFVARSGRSFYGDYCAHCMGWIKTVLDHGGWKVWHEHNHQGQCWWEVRRLDDPTALSVEGELAGRGDVRLRDDWDRGQHHKVEP